MRPVFAFIILLVAFSCMVYELALAQASSVLLGNALLNYSVTICLYLAGLGAGSLLYIRLKKFGDGPLLLNTEILLSYLGPLAPLLALVAELGLSRTFTPGTGAYHLSLQAVIYSLVTVVGVLSGLELPILISLGEERFRLKSGAVLGLDYGGTLAAVAVFPTVGLTVLGLFGTAALAGLGSWIGALLTLIALPKSRRRGLQFAALVPSLVLIAAIMIYESELTTFMARSIYLAGSP